MGWLITILVIIAALVIAGLGFFVADSYSAVQDNQNKIQSLDLRLRKEIGDIHTMAGEINFNDKTLSDLQQTMQSSIDQKHTELLTLLDEQGRGVSSNVSMLVSDNFAIVQGDLRKVIDGTFKNMQKQLDNQMASLSNMGVQFDKLSQNNTETFDKMGLIVENNYVTLKNLVTSASSANAVEIQAVKEKVYDIFNTNAGITSQITSLKGTVNDNNTKVLSLKNDFDNYKAQMNYLSSSSAQSDHDLGTNLIRNMYATNGNVGIGGNAVGNTSIFNGSKLPNATLEVANATTTKVRLTGPTTMLDFGNDSIGYSNSMSNDSLGNMFMNTGASKNLFLQNAGDPNSGNIIIGTANVPKSNYKMFVKGDIGVQKGKIVDFGYDTNRIDTAAGQIAGTPSGLNINGITATGTESEANRVINMKARGGVNVDGPINATGQITGPVVSATSSLTVNNNTIVGNNGDINVPANLRVPNATGVFGNGSWNGNNPDSSASIFGTTVSATGQIRSRCTTSENDWAHKLLGRGPRSIQMLEGSTGNGLKITTDKNDAATYGLLINNGTKDILKVTNDGNATIGGALTATGDVTAFSDRRLKKDIRKIREALAKVNQLNGYTFNKEGEDTPSTGLIAQEVQAVLPEAVKTHENGMLSVAYGNMAGILVEAIKNLDDKVTAIEKKISA